MFVNVAAKRLAHKFRCECTLLLLYIRGTNAHENWYLLYYNDGVMILHVCAFTVEVKSYDALTLVFVKEGRTWTNEDANQIEDTTRQLLGDKFGTLLRV